MLTLLSPAKKLLTSYQPYPDATTCMLFPQKTAELASELKKLDKLGIARLMKISADLATTNYQRFQAFDQEQKNSTTSYPAIFLFRGDVYKSLEVDQWSQESLAFAQSHLMILSGMYGLLRPYDLIQPYRLEMGTKLVNACGHNLYDFWSKTVTNELNNRIASHTNAIILNLASVEYSKVVDVNQLKAPMVTVHFKERKGSELKVIGIHAKKARGAMARYVNLHQIDEIDRVKTFDLLSYQYADKQSDATNLVFIRD